MGTPLRRTRRRGVSPFSSDWGKIFLYKLRRIVIIELLSFSPRFLTVLEQKIPFYYIKVRNVNAMEQGTAKLDMLHGSIWDKLLRFALPVAATAALGQLFNAADVAVVGNFASGSRTAAVAAVGANGPIINLILGLFIGIALGATVVIANAIGNNDRKSAQNAVHTSMVMAVVGGVIVAIIGELIAGSLLNLLQVPEDVYPLSLLYLRIYFLGMPAILLYNFEAAIFRSIGETKVPLIALAASGVLNVLLNLLFVIGFHMTVNGVAIATVLSNVVSSILLYRKLRKSDQYIHVEPQLLTIHWGSFRQIMRIGLPAGIQSAVFAISNIVIQSAINSLGTIVMAASSAALNIEIIAYYVMNSFSQACATFVGQNYGAGQVKRCRKILGLCILEDAIATASAIFIILFAGKFVLALFNPDPQVIDIGYSRLLIVFTAYVFSMLYEVMSGYLRGFGISLAPALLVIFGVCGIRILWISFVFPVKRTFSTILYVYPISLATTALLIGIALLVFRPSKRLAGQAQNADSASAT